MLPNGRSGTDLEVRSPGKRAVYMMKQNSSTSRETPEETSKDLDHNPYVFIVGCSRSGTTLLQRLVDAHPVIATTPETNWVLRYFVDMKTGLTSEGLVTPEMIPGFIEHRSRRFPSLGIDPGDLERLITPSGRLSYSSFVSGVLDLYGGNRGKRLVGGKRARWVRHIPTLHALWPEAKFAHLIRDGRDVCMSILSWGKANRHVGSFTMWTEDPLSTTALWWEWNVRLGREDGSSLEPGLYYEIRYESLIAHPADECAALCTFLGLPYDDEMLRFHEGRERTEPGLDAKSAWRPVTAGLRDWRSQMPAGDVERFEAAVGDLLEELGYARAVPRPSSEALKHASRIHTSFVRDLRRQGKRIPEGW
jgi:hypothetical protein